MKRYLICTADKLGTKRHSKDTLAAQERDIQLFADHFLDNDYKQYGEFRFESFLSEVIENEGVRASLLDSNATILVAYLSSIGSNADEISSTIDMLNGDIMVAELPHATAEELKIYAKLEDSKKKFIGIRSKVGIQQAKADGKNIGGLRGKTKERNEQKSKEATDMAESLKPYLQMIIQRGLNLKQGADLLNERGIKTAQGKEFKPMTVKRYLDRLAKGK